MRIVAIHADLISYKANRRTRFAEEIETMEDSMEDCVVLLASVEKRDEADPGFVVETAKREIQDRLRRLKADRVMIFPFAHLTPALSSPELAIEVLRSLEEQLRAAGLEVRRAPFGWYKEYNIKSKGHPMAEMSMVICPYAGQSCDMRCPYCENPIEPPGMKGIGDERPAKARAEPVKAVPVHEPGRV